jgi:hypothetical protein
MPFTSSMGAPVAPEHEARIRARWIDLMTVASTVGATANDQVDMLNIIAELNITGSALRTAIHEAWYYANKRAFPDKPARKPLPSGAEDLRELFS